MKLSLFRGALEDQLLPILKALVSSKTKKVAVSGVVIAALWAVRRATHGKPSRDSKTTKSKRGHVDLEFFKKLLELLKVVVPSVKSPEAICLVLLSGLLVSRTVISIAIASINGKIVKSIVQKDFPTFLKRVRTK